MTWAIAKGALPILGVTRVYRVEDADKAAALELTQEEIASVEELAVQLSVDAIRY